MPTPSPASGEKDAMSEPMKQLTQEQAIALADSKFWESMAPRERAEFQLFQDRLCMPLAVFREALNEALGRPVYTHELGQSEKLQSELLGHRPPPSLEELVNMIPAEKRIIIDVLEARDA